MKKAENVIEIAQEFDPYKPLKTTEKDFYVELYEKQLKDLRTKILINKNDTATFFITGQTGSGKSTALNFLPNKQICAKYQPVYLSGRDLFFQDDINVIDVLLMIGFKLTKGTSLESEYYEQLTKMRKVNLGHLKKSIEESETLTKSHGGEAKLGIKEILFLDFNLGFFTSYKNNKQQREASREVFSIDKNSLIELINDIILKHESKVLKAGLRSLIIIDDLEKMRDQVKIENLFVENHYVFNAIKCIKIVPVPIYLSREHALFHASGHYHFGLRITPNQIEPNPNDKIVDSNKQKLLTLIQARLQNHTLITSDSFTKIIQKSGGNIRQLLILVHESAINALSLSDMAAESIMLENVEEAIQVVSNDFSSSLMGRIATLEQIRIHFILSDHDERHIEILNQALLENQVYYYVNGKSWYEVNPLITDTVKIYAEKIIS